MGSNQLQSKDRARRPRVCLHQSNQSDAFGPIRHAERDICSLVGSHNRLFIHVRVGSGRDLYCLGARLMQTLWLQVEYDAKKTIKQATGYYW
jgi:hypothetical protein